MSIRRPFNFKQLVGKLFLQPTFKFLLLFLFLFLSCVELQVFAQNTIKVPNGKHILIDGKCDAEEWNDAVKLNASDNYHLSFKKNADYVYICIDSAKETNLMIDLYLAATNKKLYTLHASAKLGERVLEGDRWKEFTTDWNWWEIKGWTANTLRVKSFEKPTFLPGKAIEFQISHKHFGRKNWRVMFDFIADDSGTFPKNADNLKSETWLNLNLK